MVNTSICSSTTSTTSSAVIISGLTKVINVACIGSKTSEKRFSTSSSEKAIKLPSSKNVTSGIISTSVWVCAKAIPTVEKVTPTTKA